MAQVAKITHEGGNLNEYDGTVTDGGRLTADAAAAIHGSYGLKAEITNTTGIYGAKTFSTPASGYIRVGLYLDLSDLYIPTGYAFTFLRFMRYTSAYYSICNVYVGRYSPGYPDTTIPQFYIWLEAENDDLTWPYDSGTWLYPGKVYVEVELKKATTTSSNDGHCKLFVNGVPIDTIPNLDNNTVFSTLAAIRVGACSSIDTGTSGNLYLDHIIIRDDSTPINPVEAITKTFWHPTIQTYGAQISTTPSFAFYIPYIAGSYDAHFLMELDTTYGFGSGDYRAYRSLQSVNNWWFWNASQHVPFPSGGIPSAYGASSYYAYYAVQESDALSATTWYRRVAGHIP